MSELQERKRRLVAESELYREMLRLEVHNLRVYGAGVRQRFNFVLRARSLAVALAAIIGAPLGGALVRRRKRNWFRFAITAFFGLRLYRRLVPMLQAFMPSLRPQPTAAEPAPEENIRAANT